LVQIEGEVDALGVVVATSILDGEGVAPEPLNGVLLRVVLLTVYFVAPSIFITLWFGFDYGTNPPLGTLIL
jgi:hypothetical protein